MTFTADTADVFIAVDLSGIDTSACIAMDLMIADCYKLTALDVSGFDTSKVVYFFSMFVHNKSMEVLDVSSFDTVNAENANYMFAHCEKLKTIYGSDKFTVEQAKSAEGMFDGCTKLVGGNGTAYDADHINGEYARIDTADAPGYFTAKDAPEQPPVTTVTNGDVSGDGEISAKDAMLLVRYVNGWEGLELDLEAADINGDGQVSAVDAMIITRYVNGWEGYDKYFQ